MLPGLRLRRFHGSSNCYCKDNVPSSPRNPIPGVGVAILCVDTSQTATLGL
jgi:hypothetical protein